MAPYRIHPTLCGYFTLVLLWIVTLTDGCGYPGSPSHSSISFNPEIVGPGTVATYSCDSGFELLGPARRVCGENGTWVPQGIPFCVLNVAAGKAPMQSSIMGKGVPQKAVDGSTSTFFNAETCTMTEVERTPWWYVNLLEPYLVQLVRVDFGTACCANSRPATVIVRVGNNRPDLGMNPICNKFTGYIEEGRPLFLPCTTAMPGAFVSVHLEGPQASPMSICEAFVYTDQALPIERCPSFRDQPLGSTATYNGKCYIFYNNQPRTFNAARHFCDIRGGSLVDETSPALQGFLGWELYRRHRNDPSGQYWMGAVRDPRDPKNWKWINGQDVSISFWNLPGANENCSRFDGSKGWLWSDTNCHLNLNYICQHRPATCGKPERPPNSTILARSLEIGSVIEYRCAPGHLLVGPNIRSCLPTGFYSEIPPKCRYLECGRPANIPNGGFSLLNGTRYYLSTVQYHCNDGHVLVGRGNLICDVDEKWNGPPPRCDPVFCRAPPPISNGHLVLSTNSTVFGTVAEYVCDHGYSLTGNPHVTCVASGYWDGDAPYCQRIQYTSSMTTQTTTTTPRTSPTSPPTRAVYTFPPSTTRYTHSPYPASHHTRALTTVPTTTTTKKVATPTFKSQSFYYPSSMNPTTLFYRPPSTPVSTTIRTPFRPRPVPARPTVQPVSSTASFPEASIITLQTIDNEIPDTLNFGASNKAESPRVGQKYDPKPSLPSTKLTTGGIIAMVVFGGFIIIVIVIVCVVVLVRRTRRTNHSLDDNTVTTFETGSDHGLHRYYHRAWENLRYDNTTHDKLSRQETLDNPNIHRNTTGRGTIEGYREANEIVVGDVAALYSRPDKPRGPVPARTPPGETRGVRDWYNHQLGHQPRRPY